MIRFKQFLDESMVYHGVSDPDRAQRILMLGRLSGRPIQGKGFLAPVQDRTYVTQSIAYAQIYAIGGDVAGTSGWMPMTKHGEKGWSYDPMNPGYGYVFGIDAKQLNAPQPDEDSIGEMISGYDNKYSKWYQKTPQWLLSMAKNNLSPNTYQKVMGGEFIWLARAGKQLVKMMSKEQKHELIALGAHIASSGGLPIKAAWRIDKNKIPGLKRDGSNFFKLAERIK